MKVLLDTNVIFAAFAARGLAHAVFELCLERHTVILSKPILSELSAHLFRKLRMPEQNVRLIVQFLSENCLLGEEAPVRKAACRDKRDLHILGLAERARPDCIVTGDEDLLILKRYGSIPILTRREFWQKEKKGER